MTIKYQMLSIFILILMGMSDMSMACNVGGTSVNIGAYTSCFAEYDAASITVNAGTADTSNLKVTIQTNLGTLYSSPASDCIQSITKQATCGTTFRVTVSCDNWLFACPTTINIQANSNDCSINRFTGPDEDVDPSDLTIDIPGRSTSRVPSGGSSVADDAASAIALKTATRSAKVSTAAIVGGVAGVVAVGGLVGGAAVYSKKKKDEEEAAAMNIAHNNMEQGYHPGGGGGLAPVIVTENPVLGIPAPPAVTVEQPAATSDAPPPLLIDKTPSSSQASIEGDILLSWMSKQASKQKGRPNYPAYASMASIIIPFDELKLQHLVGEGSYGRVYKASYRDQDVSFKVLVDSPSIQTNSQQGGDDDYSPVAKELVDEAQRLLLATQCPTIVRIVGICTSPPAIITEYAKNGSLHDILRTAKKDTRLSQQLTWKLRLQFAIDTATAMAFLHNQTPPILHRDLKTTNLLIDEYRHCKVSALNNAKVLLDGGADSMSSPAAASSIDAKNPRYIAVEVLQGAAATMASDVWSMAVVLYELLVWDSGFKKLTPWQVVNAVMEGKRPDIPSKDKLCGPDTNKFLGLDDYIALMQECWSQDPSKRPTFDDINSRLTALLHTVID